ncbi:MAG: phage holin family protein [Actinomycetales bacterium]|nr:phage holin family protein [Candidatus Phosphoribacter baldrii]
MKNIAIKTLVNGLALWLAAIVVKGIEFGRGAEWSGTLKTVLLVALVFGLVNAIVKPILKALATPLIWLTLGLFTLVINALMLQLTSWLADKLTLAFHVQQFFWDAVLGAVIVTFVSMVLHAVIPDPKD